jgi:hypothetical protein
MEKKIILGIALILIGVMLFGLLGGKITGNFVKEEEKLVIYFPTFTDFPNPDQGLVQFDFSFPNADFKVGNKSAEILMFLSSEKVPGLKIGYNTIEKKIYAGLPMMSSNVEILDGNRHKLAYAFSKEQKKQKLFLDGKLIAEGDLNTELNQNILTGYSVMQKWIMIESPIKIDTSFE